MAAVVTTIIDAGIPSAWNVLQSPIAPMSSMFYTSTANAIAAKDAADEMTVNITMTLPRNFFYRLAFLELNLFATTIADLEDYEKGARVRIFEGGILRWNFPLFNLVEYATAGAEPGFKTDADAVATDFGAFFQPPPGQLQRELIDATRGVTTIILTIIDSSSDATAALTVAYRMRAWRYTIEQALLSGVHTPQLIV